MKRNKTQKGITLVALIITIIILLILAVVAIRAVQGNGIIGHAKNARSQYEQKAAEENELLSNLSGYITGQLGNSGVSTTPEEEDRGQEETDIITSSNIATSLSGSGTQSDPYLISDAADLNYLVQQVNSGQTFTGKYFSLEMDIDYGNIVYTPIGNNSTRYFDGTFDGQRT